MELFGWHKKEEEKMYINKYVMYNVMYVYMTAYNVVVGNIVYVLGKICLLCVYM